MKVRLAVFLLLSSSLGVAQVALPPPVFAPAGHELSLPPFRPFADRDARVQAISPLLGEPVAGFPGWAERVVYEWMNRARSDPQFEMTACGSPCATDAHCYTTAKPPLAYDSTMLGRSSRFHSDEMLIRGFFDHWSRCTLQTNIGTTYPTTCNGAAACACQSGTVCVTLGCGDDAFVRIGYFGVSTLSRAEIIDFASPSLTADQAFYIWLFENYTGGLCTNDPISPTNQNGHRLTILTFTGTVGVGENSNYATGDFWSGGSTPTKVVSGAHYPQQASSIDFWANWNDGAGPMSASVVIDGCPQAMTLSRGTQTNGAWKATVAGLQSGCHRYYFSFRDSVGTPFTYPTTGSFAVGTVACPDYDVSRPTDSTVPTVTAPGAASVIQTLCQ